MLFRPKIGLALGGGGPKGLAHLGVIKTLLQQNIPIDFIAGTSAGAIMGSMYAYSQDIASVEKHIMEKNALQMLSYFSDISLKAGFIEGNRMEKFLGEYIQKDDFNMLKIPFAAVAVDLKTGKKVVLRHGSVIKAVRASIAIPVLFKPVEIDNKILVDGGLISQVPADTVFEMGADIVIAVQLDYRYKPDYDLTTLNPLQIGELSFDIVAKHVADTEIKRAQIIIRPHLETVHWTSLMSDKEKMECVQKGVDETLDTMTNIQQYIRTNKFVLHLQETLNGFLKPR